MNTHSSVSRSIGRVFLATAAILAVPLAAMQFTDEVVWTGFDFAVAAILLAGTGSAYVLLTNRADSPIYRWGVGVALGTALFLLWAMGAVGVIGSEDDPANLMFLGVLGIAAIGALASRFRPLGMAWTMAATAAAQGLVAVIAIIAGLGNPVHGAVEVVLVNGLYVALWLAAAWLFREAAGRGWARRDVAPPVA